MTILILHGFEGHAGIHWQQWLHDQLKKKGYTVIMPQLPKPKHPDRSQWVKSVLKLTNKIKPNDLVIVGHSLGVVTALDYIEQTSEKIKGFISVAGFAEAYDSPHTDAFMKQKKLDFKKINAHIEHAYVLYGDDDPYVPQDTLLALARILKIEPMVMDMGGHLNTESGYDTFPLLLELIKEMS